MSARVERRFQVDAPAEAVWEFISDPTNRARAISVVDSFDQRGDETIWHIRLPIPLIRKTIAVRTRDTEVNAPHFVRFRGQSSAFDVEGEHRIDPQENVTSVHNVFVVNGRAPGVEGFFRRNLDSELKNLERALKAHLRRS
jgi:carbon monoxide dehydrogenase subunit G